MMQMFVGASGMLVSRPAMLGVGSMAIASLRYDANSQAQETKGGVFV